MKKSKLNFKFKNGKIDRVKLIADEYIRVINLFIDGIWKKQDEEYKNIKVESWLSNRLQKVALQQALSIVTLMKGSQKPVLQSFLMDLGTRLVEI